MEIVYEAAALGSKAMFAVQGTTFRFSGLEHLPETGGAVLAINHVSYFDFIYAGYAARKRGRRVRYLVKQEMYENQVVGFLLRQMRHVSVDRTAGRAAFAEAVAALRSGELVALFPEGTVSRSLEITAFKTGAVRMAEEAAVPLVPVVVWGSQRQWGKGVTRRLGRTHTPVHISIGAPLVRADGETSYQLTERLRTTMQQMLDEVQRGYPTIPDDQREYLPARLGGTAPTLEEARVREQAEAAARRAKAAARAARASGGGAADGATGDTATVGTTANPVQQTDSNAG